MIKLLVPVVLIFALTGCVSNKPRTAKQQCSFDRLMYMMSARGGSGSRARAGNEFDRQNPQCKRY